MKILIVICFLFMRVNASEKINYLENLVVENYEINFDKNVYEYDVVINDEDFLNIDYELSKSDIYVCVSGNGNFNKSHNIIEINVNNDFFYKINVYKTINVSYIEEDSEVEMLSPLKKEIVKLFLVTISCLLIFGFYYITFINKSY